VPTIPALVAVLLAFSDDSTLRDPHGHPQHAIVQLRDQAPDGPASRVTREPDPPGWRLYIQDPYVRDTARRMAEQAAEWFSFPQCQELLSEFADERGRPLSVRLTELGVTSGEYLRLVIFEDGTDQSRCRQSGILAFTARGSRVIYLCGRDFMRAAQREPREVRAVIIHEMLHSLGLGENPPSSKEITRRVKERCWR
jgi:hypothetical protein